MSKHVLLTGSSKGIGKEIAILLLKQKFKVYGFSRSNSINHQDFIFNKIDLSKPTAIDKLELPDIKKNEYVFLINNAGDIGEIDSLGNKNNNEIISEFNVNLISPTILCNKVIKKYNLKTNNIVIINISSGAALRAIQGWGTYCQSKAAIDMLTRIIEAENNTKIKVFSIYPGIVDTNMQLKIRSTKKEKFPLQKKFVEYFQNNELVEPLVVAKKIVHIMTNLNKYQSNMVSLRDLSI